MFALTCSSVLRASNKTHVARYESKHTNELRRDVVRSAAEELLASLQWRSVGGRAARHHVL